MTDGSVHSRSEYVSRSGRHWQLFAPTVAQVRRGTHNIVRERSGSRGLAVQATSMTDILHAFISDEMVHIIVDHTNEEVYSLWNQQHPDKLRTFVPTNRTEIWALIGLMILRGVYGGYRESVTELWSSPVGRAVFSATMSRNRFHTLLRLLRFDDKKTRTTRQASDNFVAIRQLFDMFNDNCRDSYCLSANVTIDETLRKFRGHCKFRVYMPQKSGKYGLLFCVLGDARKRYVSRMLPYTGEAAEGDTERQSPTSIVMYLSQHILGSGRNITINRYYTNVAMVEDLVLNHNLTVVGTINTNRQHVPDEMKTVAGREVLSSKFAWSGPVKMVSYALHSEYHMSRDWTILY